MPRVYLKPGWSVNRLDTHPRVLQGMDDAQGICDRGELIPWLLF